MKPMPMYETPEGFYYRLHHPRPRFKNDIESVLLFMAIEVSHIPACEKNQFKQQLNDAVRRYPGNLSATEKTVNNWRTEISALFGLIERDGSSRKPGQMAVILSENQDLIEFFRYFLYYFQYPGGFLKPLEAEKMIRAGIKFKPANYLIQVLLEGQKLAEGNKFGITKAEATHCIFNDLRVTRDFRSPKDTALFILNQRNNNTEYNNGGDITRYAGDILDYMVLAELVRLRPNYQYYLNMAELEVLQAFVNNRETFPDYDPLYSRENLNLNDVKSTEDFWFRYINTSLYSSIFRADILSIIKDSEEPASISPQSEFIAEMLKRLRSRQVAEGSMRTKEIGDLGENIIIEHEKIRLAKLNRKDVLHLIKKIPEQYAVGYDISSYEGVEDLRRFIEVKTTISHGKLHVYNFHMTPSEWSAANTHGRFYYVYRLAISAETISLFLISDPVGKYKQSLIEMIPRNGADMCYSEKSGKWEDLLV